MLFLHVKGLRVLIAWFLFGGFCSAQRPPTEVVIDYDYYIYENGATIYDCPTTARGAVAIPATLGGYPVTRIHREAFYRCAAITSITMPSTVVYIADVAFSNCTGLQEITLSPQLEYLGTQAFLFCTALKSLTIPASVTQLGLIPVSGCTAVESVKVDPMNPNYSSLEGVLYNKDKTVLLQCPAGKYGHLEIPSTVTQIKDYAVSRTTRLTSATVPASVVSILVGAFQMGSVLERVTFMGDVPADSQNVFGNPGSVTKAYHFEDAVAFTSPNWMGVPTVNMGPRNPSKLWLINHQIPHDSDLETDHNGDGVKLLMAYALNLNPNENLAGRLPKAVLDGDRLEIGFYGGTPGLTYAVEISENLEVWTTDGVEISAPDGNDFRKASVSAGVSRKFMRLVVAD